MSLPHSLITESEIVGEFLTHSILQPDKAALETSNCITLTNPRIPWESSISKMGLTPKFPFQTWLTDSFSRPKLPDHVVGNCVPGNISEDPVWLWTPGSNCRMSLWNLPKCWIAKLINDFLLQAQKYNLQLYQVWLNNFQFRSSFLNFKPELSNSKFSHGLLHLMYRKHPWISL